MATVKNNKTNSASANSDAAKMVGAFTKGVVTHGEIEELGDIELEPELDEKVKRMIAEADDEVLNCRVNLRWRKDMLDLIREAAEASGMPYQAYMKRAAYERALDDLSRLKALGRLR